jgi:F-type H+-transporting ATPase subunit epsilon
MGLLLLDATGENQVAIYGGVAEVQANRITVLAQNAELAKKIDIDRALAARERAEKRLDRAHTDQNIDIYRAQAALNRALLRLSVSGHRESN